MEKKHYLLLVFHKMHLTIFNGKVAQDLTSPKSSSMDKICLRNTKHFGNTGENMKQNYKYDHSILHPRMNFI